MTKVGQLAMELHTARATLDVERLARAMLLLVGAGEVRHTGFDVDRAGGGPVPVEEVMSDRERLADGIQEALLDLDSRQLMAEASGSNAEWRSWPPRYLAERIATGVTIALATPAPALDVEALAGALAREVDRAEPSGGWTMLAHRVIRRYREYMEAADAR